MYSLIVAMQTVRVHAKYISKFRTFSLFWSHQLSHISNCSSLNIPLCLMKIRITATLGDITFAADGSQVAPVMLFFPAFTPSLICNHNKSLIHFGQLTASHIPYATMIMLQTLVYNTLYLVIFYTP